MARVMVMILERALARTWKRERMMMMMMRRRRMKKKGGGTGVPSPGAKGRGSGPRAARGRAANLGGP
jgi:hypothetical protein